jgi:hypothetical protein
MIKQGFQTTIMIMLGLFLLACSSDPKLDTSYRAEATSIKPVNPTTIVSKENMTSYYPVPSDSNVKKVEQPSLLPLDKTLRSRLDSKSTKK